MYVVLCMYERMRAMYLYVMCVFYVWSVCMRVCVYAWYACVCFHVTYALCVCTFCYACVLNVCLYVRTYVVLCMRVTLYMCFKCCMNVMILCV